MRFAFAGLLLLCACPPPAKPPDPPPPVNECEGLAALKVTANPPKVRVNSASTLSTTGGSGRTTYKVAAGGSGGEIRGDRLVTGPTPGKDTVTAADDCGNSATVDLEVIAAFAVAPARATVKPSTSFTVKVSGTIGAPTFTPMTMASGGTISMAGVYAAGMAEGLDTIQVKDSVTGEEALLQYRVSAAAAFRAVPSKLALPSGGSVPLETVDGSGATTWSVLSGPGAVADGVFSVDTNATGKAVLQGKDDFTGETTVAAVLVMEELARTGKPHGRLQDAAAIVTGDFDGDGIADVAVGVPESDLGRPQGGAVFIYKGAATGLPATPTWTLVGDTDTAALGSVMAAGDLDGDGKDDLAISEPFADVTVADSGAVLLYRWGPDGPKLMRDPLTGLGRGNFGAALAIADVDGDGDKDLVVGSPAADLAVAANSRGVVDVFLLQKGVPVPDLGSIRVGGSDLAVDGTPRSFAQVRFGRAVAVADFNGDGKPDLASLGVVNNVILNGTPQARNQIALALHFGRATPQLFEDTPDAYILPNNQADGNEGTWRLGVVPKSGTKNAMVLLVADLSDSPDLSAMGGVKSGANAGGALLYDLTAQKPTGAAPAMPVQLGRPEAFAKIWGDTNDINAGRSFTVADLDGDNALELVLGAPAAANMTTPRTGKLLVYPLGALTAGAQVNKPSMVRFGANRIDTLGVAVAAWKPGMAAGLVSYAARASSANGDFTGRVDAFLGTGMLNTWAATSSEPPARLASQLHGQAVEVAVVNGAIRAVVGMPGYSGSGVNNDGNDIGAGQALLYQAGQGKTPVVAAEGAGTPYMSNGRPAYGGRTLGNDVAFTDFDGDGRKDAVVAAPNFVTPAAATTEYAMNKAACTPTGAQTNGGVLVHLARADGTFKEGFRLWGLLDIAGCTPAGTTACRRAAISRAGVAGGFDFDGDGKQDLAALRNNGVEVFLGRTPDDATLAKPTMGCDPVFSLPALVQAVSAINAIGDVDNDGCDEIAFRYSDGTRSGVLIAFGYDAGGTRCGGHTAPVTLRISGDPETGLTNMLLGVSTARAGKVLGDARDFLAISAGLYPYQGVTQPTVLLFDLAQVAAKRPATGSAVVGALNDGLVPLALVYKERAPGFGRMLAGNVDLTGDGKPDLVVSAPTASVNGDGTGAVFVFEGGAAMHDARPAAITFVGDGKERGAVGQDLCISAGAGAVKPAVAIGAPLSYRTGTSNGTTWLTPLDY